MTVAVGWLGLTVWWLGIAVFVLVIVPAVVLLGNRLVSAAGQIYLYAEDIAEHASGTVSGLDGVARLEETRDAAAAARKDAHAYVSAVSQQTST